MTTLRKLPMANEIRPTVIYKKVGDCWNNKDKLLKKDKKLVYNKVDSTFKTEVINE